MSKKLISQRFLRCNPLKCDRSSTARLRPLPRVLVRWLAATSIVVAPRPHGQGCSRTAGGTDGAANLRAISQQETIAWPCGAPGSRVTLWTLCVPQCPVGLQEAAAAPLRTV